MSEEITITYSIAFFAGIFSFFSPCILPLIPSYLSYISGMTYDELTATSSKNIPITFFHSLLFVLGFSLIFILLGASATYLGHFIKTYQRYISQAGGIIIIIFGLFISGIIKLPYLSKEKKINIKNKPAGYFGTLLVGIIFASGWTPCIGPILASILTLAATQDTMKDGIVLLSLYSAGIGIPFIISGLMLNLFLILFKKISKFIPVINFFAGLFLIVVGILLFFDKFTIITKFLSRI